jgi:PAS domain S-box-containing protein
VAEPVRQEGPDAVATAELGAASGVEAPAHPRQRRAFARAATSCALLWGVTALLLTAPWLDEGQKKVLADTLMVLFPLPGVAFGWAAARETSGDLRRTWLCLTATLGLWALGNIGWFYNHVLADRPRFPAVADAFYLAALGFAAVALVSYPTGIRSQSRSRLLLDAVSIACSLVFISDVVVLERVVHTPGGGLGQAILVTYPVTDVLLASGALLLLTRTPGRLRVDLGLVGAGLLVYTVTDTGYAVLGADGQYRTGTPLDLGWLGGYLLIGLAALAPTARLTERRALRHAGTSLPGTILVYSVMATAIAIGLLRSLRGPLEIGLTISILTLTAVRQSVLARDNQLLHADLEAKVASRTEELQQLAVHQQSILDAVGEGVFGVDVTGRVTFMNPAAEQTLGSRPGELIGQVAHQAFHPPLPAPRPGAFPAPELCEACVAATVMSGGAPIRRTTSSYVRRDGSVFPVEITAARRQEAGRVSGAVVVFTDISERRAVERMQEEFVSVVSHELRTPLTAIRGSLGLIAGGAVGQLPSQAAHMIDIARDNSDRLTRLINDILDLERVESDVPIALGTPDAEAIVDATLESVGPLATAAGVTLVQGTVSGRVRGDPDRLVQALTNLVSNAIKFSSRRGQVRIDAQREGDHVRFRIEDHGRGIPADRLEAVFDRFQQVDSSDARHKGGTGLGLAITKKIVERHGGEIFVFSQLGLGSVFEFTIPAAADPPAASERRRRHDVATGPRG